MPRLTAPGYRTTSEAARIAGVPSTRAYLHRAKLRGLDPAAWIGRVALWTDAQVRAIALPAAPAVRPRR